MTESPQVPSIWRELTGAGLRPVALIALAVIVIYAVIVLCAVGVPQSEGEWGQFGDAFGVITSLFNALAFAALIATVVLQSVELRETRKQLGEQAQAQRDYATAARDQILAQDMATLIAIETLFKASGGVNQTQALQLGRHLREKIDAAMSKPK